MRADLDRHYQDALADADGRGVRATVDKLEVNLRSSDAVIAMRPSVLLSVTKDAAYRSYHRALDQDLRQIAEEALHRHRGVVDMAVHTGYFADITNAAISTDGRALNNYGAISVTIGERFIADRATVLRENAWDFYERHDLGARGAEEEPGWRCVWADRAKLGVTHLAPNVTGATSNDALHHLVLEPGTGRHDDHFMEVHIFDMLTADTFAAVSLDRPLTDSEQQKDWDMASQKLAARGIPVKGGTHP